jgi:hypothetical protein
LQAVHVSRRGLLPKDARDIHDPRIRAGEFQFRKELCEVAAYGQDGAWLSAGSCAEFEFDPRQSIVRNGCHGRVVDENAIFGDTGGSSSERFNSDLDDRVNTIPDPRGQEFIANKIRPPFRLAPAGWNRIDSFRRASKRALERASEGRRSNRHLPKTLDDLVRLVKGRAALEDQVCAQFGLKERRKRPDHPDVLFQKMRRATRSRRACSKGIGLMLRTQMEIALRY